MPDDLYTHDILAWSEQQAALLRRLAAGERVNDLDWPNVIEEVESVGRSELRACTSLLTHAVEHLLKIAGWPAHSAAEHWFAETQAFLADAKLAFAPSMRQHIDLPSLYAGALSRVRSRTLDGRGAGTLPGTCPFALADLLADPATITTLLARLTSAAAEGDDGG